MKIVKNDEEEEDKSKINGVWDKEWMYSRAIERNRSALKNEAISDERKAVLTNIGGKSYTRDLARTHIEGYKYFNKPKFIL